jgi:hypothetical protein
MFAVWLSGFRGSDGSLGSKLTEQSRGVDFRVSVVFSETGASVMP